MEVEVREEITADSTALLANGTSPYPMDAPVVIIRAEEVLLVVLALIVWIAAIALFFNRWGKIRMLEPYQPKFQRENHQPTCPLAPLTPPQQRMSFSKYNVNCFSDYSGLPSPNASRRPRLNSVFVGGSSMAFMNPPRRVKSAIDIQQLVFTSAADRTTPAYSSMLPMINYRTDHRKPSITVERPHCHHGKAARSSLSTERPLLSHYQQFRNRRSSCAIDTRHHRNFISFEQSTAARRKASIGVGDRMAVSYQGPTISFEMTPSEDDDGGGAGAHRPTYSRSFEQPADKMAPLPRMATSLDVHPSFDRRTSIPEEEDLEAIDNGDHVCRETGVEVRVGEVVDVDDDCHSVIITFDEADVTANAPLLERLKSSDV